MLKTVMIVLGVVKAAVQWFRDQSRDDVAVKAKKTPPAEMIGGGMITSGGSLQRDRDEQH